MRSHLTTLLTILALAAGTIATAPGQAPSRRHTPTVAAVALVQPAVVNISTQKIVRRTRHPLDGFFDLGQPSTARGGGTRLQNLSLGSGVVVDPKGYVVTNDHVVRQADQILVSFADGATFKADLVGRDTDNDLAVLRLEGPGPYPTAKLARSGDLLLGETTIALGNPFGLGGSVTEGILSAWNRTVEFRGQKVFEDFLQTSAVINPGNSGGPLANLDGEIIGINTAIHSRGPGIGFAIPISRVREVMHRLLDPPVARRLWIGLDVEYTREDAGARVAVVDEGGPAARAGVEPGDVIVAIGRRALRDWIDFQTTVDAVQKGERLELLVERDGRRRTLEVAVETAPPTADERATFAILGFDFRDPQPGDSDQGRPAEGIVVQRVHEGSSAAEIGIRAGDVVYQLGTFGIRNRDHALDVVAYYAKRGARGVKVSLLRPSTDENLAGQLAFPRPQPAGK
ncbi:MAG: trypsin-like peptidase domain-containing protein [Planctomycetota bacterium]